MPEAINIDGTLGLLNGARFMRTLEDGSDEKFNTHVVRTPVGAHVLFSFDDDRDDEAVELDAFLMEMIQGAYVQG